MIKVNLLGKKAAAAGAIPFGLDEKLAKLGVTPSDLQEMRPGLVRLAALLAGIYFCNLVPLHFHEAKKAELDLVLADLEGQSTKLSAQLAKMKDISGQMNQLNKEEADLQRQLSAVSALQKDRSLAFRTLDSMVVSLPQKVWFNGFDYKDRTVTVRGGSWEYFPINDFVKAINESTQFTGVNVRGIASENPAQIVPGVPEAMQKIKNFDLDFRVKGTGEP